MLGFPPVREAEPNLSFRGFIYRLNGKVDILCLHGRYAKEPMESMVGKQGTFLSILRDPVEQFISMWTYFHQNKRMNQTLEEFALLSNRYQSAFSVIDESIILMKEKLCWSFDDIAYKVAKLRRSKKAYISPKGKENLKMFLSNEYELYNFFLQKLQWKVKSFGWTKMQASLIQLHKARANLFDQCFTQCQHMEKCKFAANSHKKLSHTCPCEGPFDLCKDCLALRVVHTGSLLSHYAHCIQNLRQ